MKQCLAHAGNAAKVHLPFLNNVRFKWNPTTLFMSKSNKMKSKTDFQNRS